MLPAVAARLGQTELLNGSKKLLLMSKCSDLLTTAVGLESFFHSRLQQKHRNMISETGRTDKTLLVSTCQIHLDDKRLLFDTQLLTELLSYRAQR